MNEEVINLKDVSRHFDGGLVRALNGVSLSVMRGESLAVLGPSGSGKSTLLHIIGAIDFATSGRVTVCGSDLTPEKSWEGFRNEKIGFVFQSFHLIPYLTLLENVIAALAPRRMSRRSMLEQSVEILERVGLQNRMGLLPGMLSGGEKQRAAVARALVGGPDIVLADEPTGNLDSENGSKVLDLLLDLTQERGRTLILVTHNRDLAARLDRSISIIDGSICGFPHMQLTAAAN